MVFACKVVPHIIICFVLDSSKHSACLKDVHMPAQDEFEVNPTKLVGLEFNADDQCKIQYGPKSTLCSFGIHVSNN